MAIAVRQAKQIKRAAADSATVAVTFDNAVAAGSTLVVMGAAEERLGYDTALLNSVSGGGTWHAVRVRRDNLRFGPVDIDGGVKHGRLRAA